MISTEPIDEVVSDIKNSLPCFLIKRVNKKLSRVSRERKKQEPYAKSNLRKNVTHFDQSSFRVQIPKVKG